MNETYAVVRTTLRIPGNWSHPRELVERMPTDFRLTPEALILPNRTEIEFTPMPPDDQFAEIFKSSCRQPATNGEMAIVNSYTVNVVLTGPGGDIKSALTTMHFETLFPCAVQSLLLAKIESPSPLLNARLYA